MRVLQVVGPGHLQVRERSSANLAGQEVRVRPAFVGVCGTDVEMLSGSMPYFATGHASYPVVLGHEFTGVVLDPGKSDLVGDDRVVADPVIGCGKCEACRSGPATRCQFREEIGVRLGRPGALAEEVIVPRSNLHLVPTGVTLEDATIVEPSVTAIAAAERLRTANADSDVLIVGGGTIGLIAAQVLRARGSKVTVIQRSGIRAALVRSMGATPMVAPTSGQGPMNRFSGAIEASGSETGMPTAIAAVRPGGVVVAAGVYQADSQVSWTDIVLREIGIVGVLNGPGLYELALSMIAQGAIRASHIVDKVFAVQDAADAFAYAQKRGRSRPKVLISMSDWSSTSVSNA